MNLDNQKHSPSVMAFFKPFAAGILITVIAALLVYQLPPIKNRLGWRIDAAKTGLRVAVNPIGEMPTPVVMVVQQTGQADPLLTAEATGTAETGQTAQPEATVTPTAEPTAIPTPIPPRVDLPAPAYEKQDWNSCGPVALSMYLRYYGWEGDQFSISNVIKPIKEDRNVNIDELLYYVYNHVGWLNAYYRVGGNIDMLRELLAAGVPVMIEESFKLDQIYWNGDDQWSGHYRVVTSYDDNTKSFIVQDPYAGPNKIVSYADLDKSWKTFNRVFVLLYPWEKDAAVQAILGDLVDEEKSRQIAMETALAETKADPNDAFAWFNLGTNQIYFKNYSASAAAYDRAREIGLPQRMLRYQFGPFLAYFHTGRTEDLLGITEYALKVTPNSEEALMWRGWALYRDGRSGEAIFSFQKALEARANYQDAIYGLDFVKNN